MDTTWCSSLLNFLFRFCFFCSGPFHEPCIFLFVLYFFSFCEWEVYNCDFGDLSLTQPRATRKESSATSTSESATSPHSLLQFQVCAGVSEKLTPLLTSHLPLIPSPQEILLYCFPKLLFFIFCAFKHRGSFSKHFSHCSINAKVYKRCRVPSSLSLSIFSCFVA